MSQVNKWSLSSKPITPWRASRMIVVATVVVSLAGAVLIWLLDNDEFPDLGTSIWWSLQTVTTVGYGDVVPVQTGGRIIGVVVMLQGIALTAVITAGVTAALIEQARERRGAAPDHRLAPKLDQIDARLSAIERTLTEREDRPRGS
jgi:voltage-gated potassium channel